MKVPAPPVIKNDLLEESYQYIRHTFFPAWDRKKRWKVEYMPGIQDWRSQDEAEYQKRCNPVKFDLLHLTRKKFKIAGECQYFRNVIVIYAMPKRINELYYLLIHEICHAVAGPGDHDEKWMAEMNCAHLKALEISKNLAKYLEDNLFWYGFRNRLLVENGFIKDEL